MYIKTHFARSRTLSVYRAVAIGLIALGILGNAAAEQVFHVPINKSRVIHLSREAKKIAVANGGVADIMLIHPTQLYVLGRMLGTTNVTLWDKNNTVFTRIDVEITHDLDGLKAKLHELFPSEHPKVYTSQGSIVLAGQVSSLEKMDAMLSIAKTFVQPQGGRPPQGMGSLADFTSGSESDLQSGVYLPPGPTSQAGGMQPTGASPSASGGQKPDVINLMQVGGPNQVMLEVVVAEVNRTLAKLLDVDFTAFTPNGGAIGTDARIGVLPDFNSAGGLSDLFAIAPSVISPTALFGRFISKSFRFHAVINAARERGLAKILAEPTLTTISGQEASFLSGGEFPIPVPQTGITAGAVTIEFKQFGVGLRFLPVVLDSGRINLKLNISVSELSGNNTVTAGVVNTNQVFVIPSLTERTATSSVELTDGQTIGIAGLINDTLREAVNKFPGLGDVPILGQLFTSQEFRKSQTELVIFVTPRLARPIRPDLVRLPTDSFVEPNDIEYYLMGRIDSRQPPRQLWQAPSMLPGGLPSKGGLQGNFGQQL